MPGPLFDLVITMKDSSRTSRASKPLHDLTKKSARFEWTPTQQVSFDQLELVTAPVLQHLDYSGSFIVDTDASNVSIGAVLSKKIDRVDLPLVFSSRVNQDGDGVLDHQKRGFGGSTRPKVVPTISVGRSICPKNLPRKLTLDVLTGCGRDDIQRSFRNVASPSCTEQGINMAMQNAYPDKRRKNQTGLMEREKN